MHVRPRREGVEEVFARDRVATIMQQAVAHRYHTPSSVAAVTTAADPITRLHTPEHYTVRPFSRTEHALTSTRRSCACTCTNSEHESSWWCEGMACVAGAVVAECMRHRLFSALVQTDLREACGLPDGLSSGTGGRQGSAEPLVSWQDFFELPPRWVMQSLGAVDQHTFTSAAAWQTREAVTPLDVGATVALRRFRPEGEAEEVKATPPSSPAAPHCVVATAPMAGGAYWVDIAPTDTPSAVRRVDRDDAMLSPPVPVHADPLLPCDELYSERGVNTSVYVFFLRAFQQQQQQRQRARLLKQGIGDDSKSSGDGQASPAAAAAAVSLRLARCAQQRRAQLEDRLHRHPPNSAEVTAGSGPVRLHVRVDVARSCVQLRACVESLVHPHASASAPGSLVGITTETVARHKRQRSDAETVCTDSSFLWENVESPVVEVLLRSARKLAALYDATRVSAWTGREGEDSAWPTTAATVATATLEHFVKQAEATGVPSAWHTVHMDADNAEGERGGTTTTRCTAAAGSAFLARLFTLLLRYRTLFGEQGYNQGPQAAVPPPIMEELAASFDIAAEAFASPLNAQLPQFGSLFPDTDAYFGSMGSFFNLQLGGGAAVPPVATATTTPVLKGCHVEVNPPFDTTLLRNMETHLLSCLSRAATSTQSLLFLIVLPSHDLDGSEMSAEGRGAGGANARLSTNAARRLATAAAVPSGSGTSAVPNSTDRALRESPYCLAHVLCAAAESVYVDGHQHLLESPFFCIGTPTRLILLGNAAARARFPGATTQLEQVQRSWRDLTAGALKS